MSTMLRIAGVVKESIVDGPGIRFTVFVQGCSHNCPGCHNPQTHDFEGGTLVTVESLLEQIGKNPLLDGVTLSGGEPFEQAEALAVLARGVHALKLDVMTYSGYTYEQIIGGCNVGINEDRNEGMKGTLGWKSLLDETDILVDGPFVQSKRNILLRFRGSENQRLIDVKSSRKQNRVVCIE